MVWGLIIGAVIGAVVGGITAYESAKQSGKEEADLFWATMAGIGTGAVLGAGVGFVATAGTPFLIGGIESLGSKLTSDYVANSLSGKPYGHWEDYAVAFIFGGIGNGFNIGGIGKLVLDAVARPAVNQLVQMGTRGKTWDDKKLCYDIVTRGYTIGVAKPLRPIIRGFLGALYYQFNK